jgi:sigma-B regulation protein RsbU (phosphoserine phosphatase)
MEVTGSSVLHEQLVDRRARLQAAMVSMGDRRELNQLLSEVDNALRRLETGTYGHCEVCQDPIEPERLLADPLARFCLDHLSADEQRSLEMDLELASRIQRGLLPPADLVIDGWEIGYHYRPAGVVSGDYCDVIPSVDGGFYFVLGDVSGKGVAASMLMAHLHAMFRTLVALGLPLTVVMERASRAFCESTLPTHYATLVCGHATAAGEIEVCNAGHLPIIISSAGSTRLIPSSGLPIGMFCSEQFTVERMQVAPGATLVLMTDGITESEDAAGLEYGVERATHVVQRHHGRRPGELMAECLADLASFTRAGRQADDITMLVIRRS